MGIIASVQQYDLNIPVGGSQAIDVAGDRVQFLSATDPFAVIEIRPNFAQGNITLKPGQGMRFSEQVQRWVVFNKGTVALTGMLMIGTGDFFDQRISGTVDVIDGGKARTLGGNAFAGYGYSLALASNFGVMQLWNPAGSGKNAIVEQLILHGPGASGQVAQAKGSAAALTTLSQQGQSKKLGGAASVMQIRSDYAGGLPVPPALFGISSAAVIMSIFRPNEPIVVPPGYGLNLYATLVAQDLVTSFEWYEEAA